MLGTYSQKNCMDASQQYVLILSAINNITEIKYETLIKMTLGEMVHYNANRIHNFTTYMEDSQLAT